MKFLPVMLFKPVFDKYLTVMLQISGTIGYGGIIFNHIYPITGYDTRSVKHPAQVKSVTGSKVTFFTVCRDLAILILHGSLNPDNVGSLIIFRPGVSIFNEIAYIFPGYQKVILCNG